MHAASYGSRVVIGCPKLLSNYEPVVIVTVPLDYINFEVSLPQAQDIVLGYMCDVVTTVFCLILKHPHKYP